MTTLKKLPVLFGLFAAVALLLGISGEARADHYRGYGYGRGGYGGYGGGYGPVTHWRWHHAPRPYYNPPVYVPRVPYYAPPAPVYVPPAYNPYYRGY